MIWLWLLLDGALLLLTVALGYLVSLVIIQRMCDRFGSRRG